MKRFTPINVLVSFLIGFALAVGTASAQTPPSPPQSTDVVLSGYLTCPVGNGDFTCPFRMHYITLTEGRTYSIRMDSEAFLVNLSLEDPYGNVIAADTDYLDALGRRIVFRPQVTGTYRLVATSSPATHEGFYLITIREMPAALRIESALTSNDPMSAGAFTHTMNVTLTEGRRYIIDMESSKFSAFLKLLDSNGAIVAFEDEACMERPARVVFTPTRTGNYRLVATTVSPSATGVFTLTVCED